MDYLKKLLSKTRQAVQNYHMISEGDKIAVGVSSGKDSLALLLALSRLRKFYPVPFELEAVTLSMGFEGEEHGSTAELCRAEQIPYHIIPTDIYRIVFEEKREKNPCSLCARMRRRLLCDAAVSIGAQKLALGHHMDDAVQTLFMNLIFNGEMRTFCPIMTYEDCGISVIRPLVLTSEKEITAAAAACSLPVRRSLCPESQNTERENIKKLVNELERQYRGTKHRVIEALKKAGIENWNSPVSLHDEEHD